MIVQGISRWVRSSLETLDQEIGIERVVLRATIVATVATALFRGHFFAAIGFLVIGGVSHWAEEKDMQGVIDDLREENRRLSARNKGLEGERLKNSRLIAGLTEYRRLAQEEIARLKRALTSQT